MAYFLSLSLSVYIYIYIYIYIDISSFLRICKCVTARNVTRKKKHQLFFH